MYCPNCKINTEGNFCPECGTKLVEEDIIICPKCGAKLTLGAKFCSECGTSIQQKSSGSAKSSCEYLYFPKGRDELMTRIMKEIENQKRKGKKNIDFNMIDVYAITDMHGLFDADDNSIFADLAFDVSKWDVSGVTDMSFMFNKCSNFHSDLSQWNVSNVNNMRAMFQCCHNFNSDLSKWDVSYVRDMSYMFNQCEKFNSDLSQWDVSNVTDMAYMFCDCAKFNSDLSQWDVSNVTDMAYMFCDCAKFNSDLSQWDISNMDDRTQLSMCFSSAIRRLPKGAIML